MRPCWKGLSSKFVFLVYLFSNLLRFGLFVRPSKMFSVWVNNDVNARKKAQEGAEIKISTRLLSSCKLCVGHFQKYHNTLRLSPKFCISIVSSFSYNGPKRKQKQCLCNYILVWQFQLGVPIKEGVILFRF